MISTHILKVQCTKLLCMRQLWGGGGIIDTIIMTSVYALPQGAKLFYLSGMVEGEYQKTEIHNLCRFISVMKFRPLTWRCSHPYLLADR